MTLSVPLRIHLRNPPKGIAFCLQKGKGANSTRPDYLESDGSTLTFELNVDARQGKVPGTTNFLGPFAQGTPTARFFYICVGRCNALVEPQWSGRVKIHLASIAWSTVVAVNDDPKAILTAGYDASTPNGQPALASVDLNGGWTLSKR